MATKKTTRGRPKPNRVYYAPSNGAMRRMQDALFKYDEVVSAIELKWGVDRLPWIVGTELRGRFEAQMDRLNKAIEDQRDVEHQVEVTLRGVAALEAAAIAAGRQPLTGEYIEGRMPDGKPLAVVPNGYEAVKVKRENRDMMVFTVDEVGRVLAEWLKEHQARNLVENVKDIFAGAEVESIKAPKEMLNDEIPF